MQEYVRATYCWQHEAAPFWHMGCHITNDHSEIIQLLNAENLKWDAKANKVKKKWKPDESMRFDYADSENYRH